MGKARLAVAAAAALSLLGVLSASGVWAEGQGQAKEEPGAANRPAQPVQVINDDTVPVPVEVLGTALVDGDVAATQAGDWTVGISGTPKVELSGTPAVAIEPGTTVVVATDSRKINPGSIGIKEVDVSKLSSIRVSAHCTNASNVDCAKLELSLYDISCGCQLDAFTFPNFEVSRHYEVPGTKITVGAHNGAGVPLDLVWKIYGRA